MYCRSKYTGYCEKWFSIATGVKWDVVLIFIYLDIQHERVRGLMDKAPDFGSGDCGFESHRARKYFSKNFLGLSEWMWQKVTGLAILEGLWNINHSLALSHYWSTRGLLAAEFPPWPDSPFIRQPGPAQLPGQDHIEANLSADARSTWAGETQNSPPQDFHSNWPPSSWITRACQSSRSWGLVFLIVSNQSLFCSFCGKSLEMWGIEPQTFHMQSERSTTELHPLNKLTSVSCSNDFCS